MSTTVPSISRPNITFPWSEPPAPDQIISVLPGLDWIRMPLPFALNHVNCWYLHSNEDAQSEGDEKSCLIDTGVHSSKGKQLWEDQAQKLGWNDAGWPEQLLITHYHPDHSGLAGWFNTKGGDILTSKIEWDIVQRLYAADNESYVNLYTQWYMSNGVEQSYIDALAPLGNVYASKSVASPPKASQYLSAGDTVHLAGRDFSVLTGQGHSPDMLMLHCSEDNVLIAADQVLPSITPNVSWMPTLEDQNPLSSFMQCIAQLKSLPEETLVLPSHGLPFVGLHERIDFLLAHHEQRLQEIEQALNTPHTAAQLFPLLFKRKLDNQQLSFALGETLAHLKYLESLGKVERTSQNEVDFYRAVS